MDELGNAASDMLDELVPTAKPETDSTLVEALKRIEEANLFYTLIKTDIFKESSARPDILNSVNSKIKQFAKSELNKLLNISQEGSTGGNGYTFSKGEVLALKVLSAKMLEKDPAAAVQQAVRTPQINSVSATPIASVSTPAVNSVAAPPPVVPDDQKLSGSSTTPPTPAQKEAARKALLEKANKRRQAAAAAKNSPQTASLPAGGHQGYAVPQGYVPPPQNVQTVSAGPSNNTVLGKLIGEAMGNNGGGGTVTLSDTNTGGDPNARL